MDRRDFYHQAEVSVERAQTNLLPFHVPLALFEGSHAHGEFAQDKGLPLRKEIGFPMAIVLGSKVEKLPYWFPPWFSVSGIQKPVPRRPLRCIVCFWQS